MEYTLGTMWLADAGEDAVDVLNRRLQYSKHKLRDDIEQHKSIRMSDFPAEAVRTFMDTLAVREGICLGMPFDTMLAYNELLRTRPWTAQLSAIAGDHGLPVRLAARRNAS